MVDDKEIKKEGEKPNEKKETYDYKKNTHRSLREIAADLKRKSEPKKDEKKEEKKDEKEEKPPEKKEDIKPEKIEEKKVEKKEEPKIDPEEITRKAQEEAKRIAEETSRATFKAQMDDILAKEKTDLEKQKEADELISIWDREKRLPKDYREVIAESLRISEAKFKQLQRVQEEERKTRQEEETKKQAEFKASEEKRFQAAAERVNQGLKRLIDAKILDKKDTDDFLKFGIELNQKLVSKGESPVDSLSDMYLYHYKPHMEKQAKKSDQPAGADAPVSGAAAPKTNKEPQGYVYARDHKKSYRQLLVEAKRRLAGK